MRIYAQLNNENKVVGITSTNGVIEGNVVEVERYDIELIGMKYADGAFFDDGYKGKQSALQELEEIDRLTGLPRVTREMLSAVAGEKAPKAWKDIEKRAEGARLKVKG